MKQIITLMFITFFFVHCSKDNSEKQINNDVIICSFDNKTLNSYLVDSRKDSFDINHDSIFDIRFSSYYYHSPNGYSRGLYMSILDSNLFFSLFNVKKRTLNCGDTINNSLEWNNKGISFYSESSFLGSTKIEKNWIIQENDSGYIAIRYNKKFGWMKLKNSPINVVEIVMKK